MKESVWEICEHVAEVQALLDDHVAGGKHAAREGASRHDRAPAAAGDVRRRLLPAENAVG